VLIFAAPGQGAQTPGFLSPWLEVPGLADQFGAWSELAGRDLIRLGTTGSADEITDTAVAQPLLVAAAIAVAGLLGEPDAAAGHSVGELAAGVIAGVITAPDAIALTRVRGEAMAASCGATPTGMTAVLGGDEDAVLAAIANVGLTPANINATGQIVAGGTLEQLAEFAANPPKGARLRPLRVAGAFHTKHMAPAVDALEAAAAGTKVKDPVITLLSNRDGAVVTSGSNWVDRIVNQVANPVRWDLCMATMSDIGVTAMIELLPGGTLTGMAKRALPGRSSRRTRRRRTGTLRTPSGQVRSGRSWSRSARARSDCSKRGTRQRRRPWRRQPARTSARVTFWGISSLAAGRRR
jgi:[acyl-carrier-protein] S-malonyltransferase